MASFTRETFGTGLEKFKTVDLSLQRPVWRVWLFSQFWTFAQLSTNQSRYMDLLRTTSSKGNFPDTVSDFFRATEEITCERNWGRVYSDKCQLNSEPIWKSALWWLWSTPVANSEIHNWPLPEQKRSQTSIQWGGVHVAHITWDKQRWCRLFVERSLTTFHGRFFDFLRFRLVLKSVFKFNISKWKNKWIISACYLTKKNIERPVL